MANSPTRRYALPGLLAGATLALLALLAILAPRAQAQTYPFKPIRLIIPYPPAGSTDYVGREVGAKVGEAFGQQVVIDNRPGAGTMIGLTHGARAAPDGYTITFGTSAGLAISPALGTKMPFDPHRDFAHIGLMVFVPYLLVLNPTLPVRNLKDLVALAKTRPGELTCASSGTGSTQHLALELFMTLTGVKIIHVPYKGSGQAIVDLVAGQVQMNFDTMPPVIDHIKSNRLRALAVTTPKRASQLPDIPTLDETGLKGFEMTNWYGIVAPAGVPRDIINKMSADINKALQDPGVRKRLVDVGTEIGGGSPESFDNFIKTEIAKYTKLVKAANVQLD